MARWPNKYDEKIIIKIVIQEKVDVMLRKSTKKFIFDLKIISYIAYINEQKQPNLNGTYIKNRINSPGST